MNVLDRLRTQTGKIWPKKRWLKKIDMSSLQLRLTLGIAGFSALGIGSVALWTSWQMQQQLITSHKQNLQYISQRFTSSVEFYSHMKPPNEGLKPAIVHWSGDNVWLWVRGKDGAIVAESMKLISRGDRIGQKLIELPTGMLTPEVYPVNDRYFIWCSGPLKVKGMNLGYLYIAQDITSDYLMLVAMIRGLVIASVVAIMGMTVAAAMYVGRSLAPLSQLSQLTSTIGADDLSQARMSLENAPTEVKELAQTCNTMLARLSEAWENQRQFVSNVSHELRTPLTIVSGYLQSTLRRGNNLSEAQRDALTIANGEAQRTISLLQDLLDLARADNGHFHFYIEPILLKEIILEVVEMARQYSQHSITIESAKDPMFCMGDRNRLKQVLINLIDNAVKYSQPDQPISLKYFREGDWVKIQVCDRGLGIALAEQSRIFDRFYRVDRDRDRSTGGTGLGLSIVKTLIEGMGGQVSVRSTLGIGSIFTISLKIKK